MKMRFVGYIAILSFLCALGCNKQPSLQPDSAKAEVLQTATSSEVAQNNEVSAATSDAVKAVMDVEMSKEFIKKLSLAYQDYENIGDVAREMNCRSCDEDDVPENYKTPEEIADGIFAKIRELGDKIPELIQSGLDVNIRDEKGNTLLFYTYSDEAVEALIKASCDVNAENSEGETAIFYGKGQFNHNYKMLVEAGLDINHKNKNGMNVLDARIFTPEYVDGAYEEWLNFPNFDTLKLLIAAGADINAKDNQGKTLLTRYLNYTSEVYDDFGVRITDFCIEQGANVNIADNKGMTPLMLIHDSSIIKKLIEAGADVNAKDNAGKSVLQYHLDDEDDAEIVEILKNAGAQ